MAEWFEEWFGEEYLALYPHRDHADATRLIGLLRRTLSWRQAWRVLDVGCGPGRHARAIEECSTSPIGLDLSASLLRRAREVTGAPLVRGDMRALPIRTGSMDLVMNLFTSFGYFETDTEHRDALEQMIDALRPAGWFAIDYLNARLVRERLVTRETTTLAGRTVTIDRALSDGGRFVRKTITMSDGREYLERVRLFDPDELEQMIVETGGIVRHHFGDYDGGSPGPMSPRVILLTEHP